MISHFAVFIFCRWFGLRIDIISALLTAGGFSAIPSVDVSVSKHPVRNILYKSISAF